ncbi:MAG: heterodisulfide reductase-related iron-sulfur binding cluster, partial [Promethearchaeota archaeon]
SERQNISWPCTSCHSCLDICPADTPPRKLINEAMRNFLLTGDNMILDYHSEYTRNGRVGASTIDLESFEPVNPKIKKLDFFTNWDQVVIYPGCLVSSRFPSLVEKLYRLLIYLNVEPDKIVVDDDLCCGSFNEQVDLDLYMENGQELLRKLCKRSKKNLLVTMCGSCTRALKEFVQCFQDRNTDGTNIDVLHYFQLLATPDIKNSLLKLINGVPRKANKQVYLQFPCQVEWNLKERKRIRKAIVEVIESLAMKNIKLKNDYTCCGASILDTHPDFAIEYGIERINNICRGNNVVVDDILIGCGNCYRIYSDFKPSMDIENDDLERIQPKITFLLDVLLDTIECKGNN